MKCLIYILLRKKTINIPMCVALCVIIVVSENQLCCISCLRLFLQHGRMTI